MSNAWDEFFGIGIWDKKKNPPESFCRYCDRPLLAYPYCRCEQVINPNPTAEERLDKIEALLEQNDGK